MPQINYPITLQGADTVYIINSDDELRQVPDSIIPPEAKQLLLSTVKEKLDAVIVTKKPESGLPFGVIIFMLILIILAFIGNKYTPEEPEEEEEPADDYSTGETAPCHHYKGADLHFSKENIYRICEKYNPYFNKLTEAKKQVFISRIESFLIYKDFYIVSDAPYREMPVLMAAAAIQISFGLQEFHFPHFKGFVIHPEEYIAYNPLRILVGNVQGKLITISWKHFLQDYQHPTDGKNVGLHEMAHALQVQYLFENYGSAKSFQEDYAHYDKIDDHILQIEKLSDARLFDDNALRNSDEFWATSVELFFEKPAALKNQYPDLYHSIAGVLNQDTAAMEP
jgi:Mlc titration factor MtfA (ptsG expression regulator)